jgi:NAD(P)-dependent dehydrogenase (short-subunit alcohol dehydrogenase family)
MNPEHPDEAKKAIEKTIPIERLASTRDIGYLAAFLASDEASYITGSELLIDGGLTLPESGSSFHD